MFALLYILFFPHVVQRPGNYYSPKGPQQHAYAGGSQPFMNSFVGASTAGSNISSPTNASQYYNYPNQSPNYVTHPQGANFIQQPRVNQPGNIFFLKLVLNIDPKGNAVTCVL